MSKVVQVKPPRAAICGNCRTSFFTDPAQTVPPRCPVCGSVGRPVSGPADLAPPPKAAPPAASPVPDAPEETNGVPLDAGEDAPPADAPQPIGGRGRRSR